MKKTYINPVLSVVKLQTNRSVLISMSIGGETDTVESREFDYDEDYEDEEY